LQSVAKGYLLQVLNHDVNPEYVTLTVTVTLTLLQVLNHDVNPENAAIGGGIARVDYRPFVEDISRGMKQYMKKNKIDPDAKIVSGNDLITNPVVLPENVDGSILVGLLRDHFYAKKNTIQQKFHEADLDNSGKLSHHELNLLLCDFGFDIDEAASKRMIHEFGEFGQSNLSEGVSYDAFSAALKAGAFSAALDMVEPVGDAKPEAVGEGEANPKPKKKKKSKKQKVFESLDRDDEQVLEAISEKVYGQSISFVDSFMQEDQNHDGIVDLNEFMDGLKAFGVDCGPGAAMHLFHVFDTKHTGRINIEDFVAMLIVGDVNGLTHAKHGLTELEKVQNLERAKSKSHNYVQTVAPDSEIKSTEEDAIPK